VRGASRNTRSSHPTRPRWPEYRTVWRWHFYAGLFCIPFVIWLAVTGSIYLFRPQIEAWLDRPYDHLGVTANRSSARAQVAAAIQAVPGGRLNSYELPAASNSSVRVLVGKGRELYRVYVHPGTGKVLHIAREDSRPMRLLFYLHGELLMGAKGSMIVELAASWAMIMILTGIFMWWPRNRQGMGGVLYPRIRRGRQIFWRDVHSVTGMWVSFFALFMIASGLPWATSWGNLLKSARQLGSGAGVSLDWTTGRESELESRAAMNAAPNDWGEHTPHARAAGDLSGTAPDAYEPIDRLVATVAPLALAPPVLISPPSQASSQWEARSDSANRPQRTNIVLDPATGTILSRHEFSSKPFIDRIVGIGVAAHEGQLFGTLNQLLGIFTACGLIAVSISAVVLWWRRRPPSVLGAPQYTPRSHTPATVIGIVITLGVVLPLLGLSILSVFLLERTTLSRIPSCNHFLGLSPRN